MAATGRFVLSSEKGCAHKNLGRNGLATARNMNELFIVDGCSNQISFWTLPKHTYLDASTKSNPRQ